MLQDLQKHNPADVRESFEPKLNTTISNFKL